MAERAGLFEEGNEDFDVSAFAPKEPAKAPQPATEAIRNVAEKANFQSREPTPSKAPKKTGRRIWRTGRNVPFAHKVTQVCNDGFYQIAESKKWTMGETLERALGALQREMAKGES